MRARSLLVSLSVVCALAFAPRSTPAQQSPHAQPRPHTGRRCPRHRPATGDACTAAELMCDFRCGAEGDHDLSCACTRGPDDALHWHCVEGQLCGE